MSETIVRTEFDDDGPLPPGLLAQLSFIAGPLQGKVMKLDKRTTTLGRNKGDVILNDNAASGEHAIIGFDGGRFFVRDLNSTNGTMLNGGQVWEGFLNSGDEITAGASVMRIDIKQSASSASWADLGMEDAPPDAMETSGDVTQPLPELAGKDPLSGPLPPGVKAGMQVVAGLDSGTKHIIKKRGTLIGRVDVDLELHDLTISRRHASIEFMSKDRIVVKDLRSKNGTFLNDKWVTIGNLGNGDVIKIGNTLIKIFIAPA